MIPDAKTGALVPALSADDLVRQTPSLSHLDTELDVIQLLNKDSSNLNPQDWQTLIRKIRDIYDGYDGFVVTHGTDTLANTSTATALAIGKELAKPIVFTGAQEPINKPGTDARVNLERSVMTSIEAVKEGIAEVLIVFSHRVLRAARSIKASESEFDAFQSPAQRDNLGVITATGITFSPLAFRKSDKPASKLNPKDQFANNFMSIDVRPGLGPELVSSIINSEKCGALILKSLGAGNVPDEKEYSLLPVIKEAVNLGKPVIIATKFVGGKAVPHMYGPGLAALEAGAGHSGNMTDVATEVKLSWLMGQGIKDPEAVSKHMLQSYVGELD